MKVRLHHWRVGLDTVSLIKLVRDARQGGLAAAKKDVEGLLDGSAIDVPFETAEEAEAFLHATEAVGAVGDLLQTDAT